MNCKEILGVSMAVMCLCLCAVPGLSAETKVEVQKETGYYVEATTIRFDEAGLKGLEVETSGGDIRCRDWDKSYIEVRVIKKSRKEDLGEAQTEFKRVEVFSNVFGGNARVQVKQQGIVNRVQVDVEAQLPHGSKLGLSSGGGDVDVADLSGAVEAKTGGGDVLVRRTKGPVRVKTGGGDVKVNDVKEPVEAASGGGDLTLSDCQGQVACKTGGGDVRLKNCAAGFEVATGGGDIRADDCGGKAELRTGGGDIEVRNLKGALSAETGGGDIDVSGVEKVEVKTGGGDINLSGVKGSVEAKTGGGDIDVDACGISSSSPFVMRLKTGGGDVRVKAPELAPIQVVVNIEIGLMEKPEDNVECFFPLQFSTTGKSGLLGLGKRVLAQGTHTVEGAPSGVGLSIEIETGEGCVHILQCAP